MMLAATASSGIVVAELAVALLFGGLGFWLSERYRRNWGRTPWGLPSLLWAFIFFLSLLIGAVLFIIAQRNTRSTSTAVPGQSPPWYPSSMGGFGGSGYPPSPGGYPPPPGSLPVAPPGELPSPPPEQPSAGGNVPSVPGASPVAPWLRKDEAGQPPTPGTGGRRQGPGPRSSPAAYAPPGRPPGYVSPDPGARPRPEETPTVPATAEPAHVSHDPSMPAWLGDPSLRHELRYWNGDSWTDWVSDGGQTATDPYGG
jgi:hypothetical protein